MSEDQRDDMTGGGDPPIDHLPGGGSMAETLDAVFAEIGFCRMKSESDESFKRRVELRIEKEKWFKMAETAQSRLQEILTGSGPDADATEIAAIRTVLERADGSPSSSLSGSSFILLPVTDEQIARFVKRHASKLSRTEKDT